MLDQNNFEMILKKVIAAATPVNMEGLVEGAKSIKKNAALQVISSENKEMMNSFDAPQAIVPVSEN